MTVTNTSLGALVDETLDHIYRAVERPRVLVVGANSLSSSSSDRQFTLEAGADLVHPTALVEIDSELLLVSSKTDDADPVFTCSRGYLGTTVAAHTTGTPGLLNPSWPRYTVARAVRQALGPLSTWVPNVTSDLRHRNDIEAWVEVPDDTLDVLDVSALVGGTRWQPVPGWTFEPHAPEFYAGTGKVVRLPRSVPAQAELVVRRHVPYQWRDTDDQVTADPAEDATVGLPSVGADLPALYAACRLLSGREMARLEIDKAEEAHNEISMRQGANHRLVQLMWQDFYRRLDEVRRTVRWPRPRPYRQMPRTG
jgi:hypothetical protein